MKTIRLILSIVLFVDLFLFTIVSGVKYVVTRDNIADVINDTDLNSLLIGTNQNALKTIKNDLETSGIPSVSIDTVINSGESKALVTDYIFSIFSNVVYKTDIKAITGDDIYNIVDGCMDEIVAVASLNGITLSESDQETIMSSLQTLSNNIANQIPTFDEILNEEERDFLENDLKLVRFIVTDTFRYISILVIIVVCVLLVFISVNKFHYFFSVGLPVICSGLVTLISCLILNTFIKGGIKNHINIGDDVIDDASKFFLRGFRNEAIIMFFVGLMLVAVGIAFRVFFNKPKEELS